MNEDQVKPKNDLQFVQLENESNINQTIPTQPLVSFDCILTNDIKFGKYQYIAVFIICKVNIFK